MEGWIKNLPRKKNFVRRIYVEMPARHLNMILEHAIISKSQQVLIEAILPFSKDLYYRNRCNILMFILALSLTVFMLLSIKIFLQYIRQSAMSSNNFSKKPNNYWDANAFNIWKLFTRESNWCIFIWELFPQWIHVFCWNDKNIFQRNIRKEITSRIKNKSRCPKVFGYFLFTVLNMVYFLCNL